MAAAIPEDAAVIEQAHGSPLRVAVICGGPSGERGISLNSARSVCDHLHGDDVEIAYVYLADLDRAYTVRRGELYSNTPLDFDFKLAQASRRLTRDELRDLLRAADLVLPLIHGRLGEDGVIQGMLEAWGCTFLGSTAEACHRAYPKHAADDLLEAAGLLTLPYLRFASDRPPSEDELRDAFAQRGWKEVVVKPTLGGSSLGVSVLTGDDLAGAAHAALGALFAEGSGRPGPVEAVCEPRCHGREFTILVLEGRDGRPVALIPTEIELIGEDVFDYRHKYLATDDVLFHCPPRMPDETIVAIQDAAEEIFRRLGMRHFARFDGWVLDDGRLYFSDFNPISGMEQNSFLFQQTSRLGMSHKDTLRYLIERVLAGSGKAAPSLEGRPTRGAPPLPRPREERLRVNVLGGGVTAEREVSILSSTNVWLKLRGSARYRPELYLMATEDEIWHLPYTLGLSHTVREIAGLCERWHEVAPSIARHGDRVVGRLGLTNAERTAQPFAPRRMTRRELLHEGGFVFIGLHGGIGEDGRLQRELEEQGVRFNGSGSAASRVCMDKMETGRLIEAMGAPEIRSAPKEVHAVASLRALRPEGLGELWSAATARMGSRLLVVKPTDDGCSAGVAVLEGAADLRRYLDHAAASDREIPAQTFRASPGAIKMPGHVEHVLLERFVDTDKVSVESNTLHWPEGGHGWVEITVGVLGPKGALLALPPSLPIAEQGVLSLEEKFQGGTGINVTPLPEDHVPKEVVLRIMRSVERVAEALGIEGYARIDAFAHVRTGDVIVIEANTLPGLSPSTVIFHQALALDPPLFPLDFLERIIELGTSRGVRP